MDEAIARYCEVLEDLIRRHGASKVELEKRLGWSRGALTKLLKTRKKLTVDHLLALLGVLDIEPLSFYVLVHGGGRGQGEDEPWTKAFDPLGPGTRPIVLSHLLTEEELDQRIREAVTQALSRREKDEP